MWPTKKLQFKWFFTWFFSLELNCKNILFHRDVADGMKYLQSKDVVHR